MGIFARALSTSFPLFTQVFVRIFAAFLMCVVLFSKDFRWKTVRSISRKDWFVLIVRSICFYAIGIPLFTLSIIETKYGNVSFVNAIPLSALLGWILLREKMTPQKFLFLFLAFFGVVLISVADFTHIWEWGKGEMLALLSSFAFSISYIGRRWQTAHLSDKQITTFMLGLGSLAVLALMGVSGQGLASASWSFTLLGIILLAGVFNAVNLFLTNYGFAKVEAILAGNILMLESVFGLSIGILFYREIPVVREMIGGLLILVSVWRMNRIR